MLKNLIENGFSSRLVVVGLLSFATVMAGMGTLKLYLPPHTSWALIGLPIVGAAMLEIRRQGWLHPVFNWKHAIPLLAFLVAIVLAVVTNDLTRSDLIFSGATSVKFIMIWLLLLVPIQTRVNVRTVEVALISALVVGALGFSFAAIFNPGLIAAGRVGWAFAWYGVFWKIGMYAFPFLMWRSLRNPTWADLPALLLATLVVSLDGSRTGLLALIFTVATMILIGAFVFRMKNLFFGSAITLVSLSMSFLLVQPAFGLAWQWEFAQSYVSWALLCGILVVAVTEIGRAPEKIEYVAKGQKHIRVIAIAILFFALLFSLLASKFLDVTAFNRFQEADPVRLEMLSTALKAAGDNLPFGGGLGTTTAMDLHVHFTYLQLVADVGPLGLISYLAIFGVFGLWYIQSASPARVNLVPGLAVMGVFLLQGVFAPLTNELTEWLPVLLGAAAFYFAAERANASPHKP